MISSCCSVVTVLFTRLSIFQNFYTSSLCFSFPLPTLKRRSKSLGQFVNTAREKFRIHAPPSRVIECFFLKKSPPPKKKSDFQSITEEPKYEAKALTVVTDTIKKLGPQCVLVCDFTDNMKVVARGFERKQNCCSP